MTNIEENEPSETRELDGRMRLSEILLLTFDPTKGAKKYGELIDELSHHGMAIVLVFFSIPAALPVPAAGYSTVLSLPLFLIGFSFLFGRESLWLPERWREKEFNPASFQRVLRPMLKLSGTIERFSKPRLTFLFASRLTTMFLGILICALAASMVLPIPGTNTLPAGGIFLIGFSLLEDDGVLLLLGILYSLAALAVSVLVIVFGYEAVKLAIKTFVS